MERLPLSQERNVVNERGISQLFSQLQSFQPQQPEQVSHNLSNRLPFEITQAQTQLSISIDY